MKTTSLFPLLAGWAATAALAIVLAAAPGHAFEVDILLDTNPPPQSADLLDYIESVRPESHILVGFDGADLGEGPGDGRNEIVAASFEFDAPERIVAAFLTVDFTKGDRGADTDNLNFADDMSPWGEFSRAYGNALLRDLESGVRQSIRVDLFDVPGRPGDDASYDLSELLADGDLDVAFTDDSIVHSMRLQVRTSDLPDLEDLAEMVRAASLHHGIENALLAKIRAASRALEKDNEEAARGSLQAFLNHVRAQRGKKIPVADADVFTETAHAILDDLAADDDVVADRMLHGERSLNAGVVASFELAPSAPNPFSRSTEIRFQMNRAAAIDLAVYDVSGRRVRAMRSGQISAGSRTEVWNGLDDSGARVAAGTYFVRLRSQDHSQTRRVVLVGR